MPEEPVEGIPEILLILNTGTTSELALTLMPVLWLSIYVVPRETFKLKFLLMLLSILATKSDVNRKLLVLAAL